MVSGIIVLVLAFILSFTMISSLKRKYPFIDERLMRLLVVFHFGLAAVYYLYALFNPSDSLGYYLRIVNDIKADTWGGHYGTSTTFIVFVGYPFVKFFGFSYEACMVLFAFFGFVGFLYFYIFFKEQIRFKHRFFGFDLITIFFFLPNLHFWSTSFGKGSIILMGLGLFFYGLSKLQSRWFAIILGGLIIYHVRPHIMLVILLSSAIGFMFTTKGVSIPLRVIFLVGVGVAFYVIYGDVLKMVGLDEGDLVTESFDLTHRASELTKATSGVDITSYSLPLQVFTFLFRPLFFDAPGALGLIVSFENVFYLLMAFKIFSISGVRYLLTSNFLVKTTLLSFLTVTIALSQISGNLGLAMRQKSQVMLLFLFVILSFLDAKKMKLYRASIVYNMRRARLQKVKAQQTS